MCTVVIRVPEPGSGDPVQLLAVRDEDPSRPWRPLGQWWPDRPGVTGVRDELAGGAWLATDGTKLAVLLNRLGQPDVEVPTSRGTLVLEALAGKALPDPITTLGFNLVEVTPDRVMVSSWTGDGPARVVALEPGTHMVAHDDVDDPRTARVAAWLEDFAEAGFDDWLGVLADTTAVGPVDERAIIRDNRPYGIPTMSLYVVLATVADDGVELRGERLHEPGVWNELEL